MSFLPARMVYLCHAVCKSWHMAHAWREVGVKHSSLCRTHILHVLAMIRLACSGTTIHCLHLLPWALHSLE